MACRVISWVLGMAALVCATPKPPSIVVRANYMHLNYRCPSCLKLERWSSLAIQRDLRDSVKAGRLQWSTQNMETPEGSALADKVGLTTKALVLMEMRGGRMVRFKELKDTWKNLRDSTAFAAYVKYEALLFLKTAR